MSQQHAQQRAAPAAASASDTASGSVGSGADLPAMPGPGSSPAERARVAQERLIARCGAAPSLESYRRAFAACGAPWPGDDAIRQQHPVADSAA